MANNIIIKLVKNTGMKLFYKGYELYNIKELVNDFNFFDISAWYQKDGKIYKGKFRYDDLLKK